MALADVNFYVEGLPANEEAVQLEVSDGETYVSRKFAIITEAFACGNTNVDAHINVTLSAGTATINYAGQTDKVITLVLRGTHNK